MTVHRLERDDPRNVHHDWDPARPAVLEVDSGDELLVGTRSGEDGQLGPGSTAADVERLDWSRLHALTGPVAVAGARPGDVLQVDVLGLVPDAWGFVMHRPGAGMLPSERTYFHPCPIDVQAGTARFAAGLDLPLAPMLGVMGVAPPERRGTRPPGAHGGNLDCAALTAGATLYLPVFVPGALFSCGDGHARQGDGEACVTGLETGMEARLRLTVRRDLAWRRPRAEDARTLMTLGAGERYEDAASEALDEMVTVLSGLCGLERPAAYALASLVCDLRVNQLVNPEVGARAVVDKAVLGLGADVWRRPAGAPAG